MNIDGVSPLASESLLLCLRMSSAAATQLTSAKRVCYSGGNFGKHCCLLRRSLKRSLQTVPFRVSTITGHLHLPYLGCIFHVDFSHFCLVIKHISLFPTHYTFSWFPANFAHCALYESLFSLQAYTNKAEEAFLSYQHRSCFDCSLIVWVIFISGRSVVTSSCTLADFINAEGIKKNSC